jgi:hypothetical protein
VSARTVNASATVRGSATLVATGRVRTNLSMTHLFSAARFSRAVGAMERAHAGEAFGEFFEEVFANASACILLAVAALEAFANELFIDHAQHLPSVSPAVVERVWAQVERSDVVAKIDLALVLEGRAQLDRSRRPVQDVLALVDLRNSLTHFKPGWQDEAVKHRRLSKVLKPIVRPSPFLPEPELLFPRRWASHHCTAWALRSVVGSVRKVEASLGGESRMDRFQARLIG